MAKKKVTLPRIYNPGKGHPAETLAYLNPMEHELIRQLTDGTFQRGPGGIKSYADDSASSNGVSRGDNSGTKSGGLGQGGQGGGSTSGTKASNSPGGGVSTGGSGVSGSKGGGASTQSPGAGGNAGTVSRGGLSNAARGLQDQRTTAMGRVSQAAQSNASQSRFGGPSYGMNNSGMSGAASVGLGYKPDRWEQDVGYLAGRTIAPTRQEGALAGYANPYSAVDPRLIEGAAGMIRKAEAATGARATINDAYRSYWHQAVGSPPSPGRKAQPGNSWHQAGTAIDIGYGPVQDYLNANRKSLPGAFGMSKPESLINSDKPHFQVAGTTRPFAGSRLTSGLRPVGSANQLASLEGNVPSVGNYPGLPAGTQVAGIANAGLADAMARQRAEKAAQAASALGQVQGPPQAPQGIPAPNSIGINPSRYSGYGNLTAPATPQPASSPPPNPISGMSYNPPVSPLGTLPAAKPKDIQVAWNVPPMGGSVPSQYGDLFGVWGSNRPLPKGPAATPGTIHTQTAQADDAPSIWQGASNWVQAKATQAKQAYEEAKPALKFAQEHPVLAKIGMSLMMGGGHPGTSGLGTAQDRSYRNIPPPQPINQAPQQTQMAQAGTPDPMSVLSSLKANMIAQGASPEDLAYVQSIIDELSNSQVA